MIYKKLKIVLFAVVIISLIPIIDANTIYKTTETDDKPNVIITIYESTWYVGGSEPSNFSKIQDAIDYASSGDTVFVYDDSSPYNENLIINKTINLIGENKESTVINGDSEKNVIVILAENVHISGFSIQMTGPDEGTSGISILKNFSLISDNIILNNDWGIYIYNSFFNSIIRNKFLNNDCGLSIRTSENIIKDNQFFNNGIYLSISGNIIENNTVNYKPLVYLENKNNQIIDYECGQIILGNCDQITIQNQRIQKSGTGIILFDCNNCLVIGNDVIESKGGLILSNSNNNNISYNDFYQNKNFGINLYSSDYNIIEHNLCMKNIMGEFSYNGISLSSSDNNTIKNNVIEKNNVGIECSRSFDNIITGNEVRYNHYIGIKLGSSSENNLIDYNRIIGNDRGVILTDIGFNSIIKNNFIDNDEDMIVEVIQYYKLRLNHFPHISENYWGKARILPKFIPGKFTFIWMDVPWGGGITINWIYLDWHPANKENYQI